MLILMLMLSIPLEPVEGGQVDLSGSVDSTGGFFCAAGNKFHHWNRKGLHLQTLQLQENVLSGGLSDNIYWVMSFGRSPSNSGSTRIQYFTEFFDSEGKSLGRDSAAAPYVNRVDGFMFGPLDVFSKVLVMGEDYRPFLVKQFALNKDRAQPRFVEGEVHFFRVPSLMQRHHFDFKRIWATTDRLMATEPSTFLEEGGSFLALYEIEARIYHFNKKTIARELLDKHAELTYTELDLPGYVQPPNEAFTINQPMVYDEFVQMRKRALKKWSRIVWFGKYKGAYLVAYQLPFDGRQIIRLAALSQSLTVGKTLDLPANATLLGTYGGDMLSLTAEFRDGKLHPLIHHHRL